MFPVTVAATAAPSAPAKIAAISNQSNLDCFITGICLPSRTFNAVWPNDATVRVAASGTMNIPSQPMASTTTHSVTSEATRHWAEKRQFQWDSSKRSHPHYQHQPR